jgi:hypothetical protein
MLGGVAARGSVRVRELGPASLEGPPGWHRGTARYGRRWLWGVASRSRYVAITPCTGRLGGTGRGRQGRNPIRPL